MWILILFIRIALIIFLRNYYVSVVHLTMLEYLKLIVIISADFWWTAWNSYSCSTLYDPIILLLFVMNLSSLVLLVYFHPLLIILITIASKHSTVYFLILKQLIISLMLMKSIVADYCGVIL